MKPAANAVAELIGSEAELVAASLALGAAESGGPLAKAEGDLARTASDIRLPDLTITSLRALIEAGEDPLGTAFSIMRSAEERRAQGATYTPAPIVRNMIEWAASKRTPCRVIDPGVGSARFLKSAGSVFSKAQLVGIDVDPLATLMARANLAVAGLGHRSRVILGDFRRFNDQVDGSTLYIGNPPYVRHHQIDQIWKEWLGIEAAKMNLAASKLAGLHVYFFLAAARAAKPKDMGAFITASEWLDVNYGAL